MNEHSHPRPADRSISTPPWTSHTPPRAPRRAGVAVVSVVAASALTLGMAVGGCALVVRKAVQVTAEAALEATASAFFERLGQDRAGVHSPQEGGRRRGDTPGLYGGALNTPTCDRSKLVALLSADPTKAAAWAATQGITPAEIGAFVARTTPVLLRHDSLVRNHYFRDGRVVGYPALLQAGTAVLVDPWGLPVVKCGCGNPLKSLSVAPERRIEPNGMAPSWKREYDRKAVVTVTGGEGGPLTGIVLTDLDHPDTTIMRPTGTDGEADTRREGRPDDAEDDPSPTSPTTRPPTTVPHPPTTRPGQGPSSTAPSRTASLPVRLTLSTSTVAVGGSYTARATGFDPGERITFGWTGLSTETINTVTADATGTASISVREGAAPGDYRIHAQGADFGRIAVAPLRVVPGPSSAGPSSAAPARPALTLSTSTVAVGGSYTARATGFDPGERITFRWTGLSTGTINTITADATGTASISVREGAAPGQYRIHADGLGSGRTANAPLRVT